MSQAKTVETFMNDPIGFFDESVTGMHSIPRFDLEALQRKATSLRFAEQRDGIDMVRKLADRLEIAELTEFDITRCAVLTR